MKKQVIFLSIMLTLTACSVNNKNNKPVEGPIASTSVEKSIDFQIERTTLSKGFQSVNPHVEIVDKDTEPAFLVNLGIVECSKINIDKITKASNEIKIYASRTIEENKKDIVVPQLLIKLDGIDNVTLKDTKFSIINSNYEPIKVAYDKNQVLNNIYAQFKITSNTVPKINLINEDSKYIWDVDLHNIFAKEQIDFPLVYFKAKVDASSGEFIETSQQIISTTIDKGNIIDYVDGKSIIYIQKINNKDGDYQNLWLYDIQKNKKEKIYSTHNTIYSAKFSPDLSKIAIIEHNGKLTDIFIVNLSDNTTQKITPLAYKHSWNIEWYGKKLYALNNDEKSRATLLSFDLEKNEHQILFSVSKNISDFDVYNEKFVFTEFNEQQNTKEIFITSDGKELKKIDSGHIPKFIDSNILVYKKNVINQNKCTLWLYDINNKVKKSVTDMDIRSFSIIDSDTLVLVGRENYGTEFSSFIYKLNSGDLTALGHVISETVYYNSKANTIYFSAIPPIDNLDTSQIYSIDLNNILN